jgi:hypothetical protein
MSFSSSGSSAPFGPDPELAPPPTPAPGPDDEGEALGPPGASTTALSDALDEPILTAVDSGEDLLLSTAGPGGLPDPYGPAQGGWTTGPQDANPYTGAPGSDGTLSPYAGAEVDPYAGATAFGADANSFAGGQDINPFTGLPDTAPLSATDLGSSQLLAFNGPAGAAPADATPSAPGAPSSAPDAGASAGDPSSLPVAPDGRIYAPNSVVTGQPADPVVIDGTSYAHYQVTLDGTIYDAYANDMALPRDLVWLVPATPPAAAPPAAPGPAPGAAPSATPAAPGPLAPTASAPGPAPPAESGWGTAVSDLFAGIAGLMSPASVGAYLHPQFPAGLPPGLQQMGQLNAAMARQSLQDASYRTRGAIAAAGAPYALTMGALAAPAAGALSFEASLQVTARFPAATSLATNLTSVMTGLTLPQAAAGAGSLAAGRILESGAEEILAADAPQLAGLAPAAVQSLSAASAWDPALQPGQWVSVARAGSEALEAQGYWAGRPGVWSGSSLILQEYQIGDTKFDNVAFGAYGDVTSLLEFKWDYIGSIVSGNQAVADKLVTQALGQLTIADELGIPLEWHVADTQLQNFQNVLGSDISALIKWVTYPLAGVRASWNLP